MILEYELKDYILNKLKNVSDYEWDILTTYWESNENDDFNTHYYSSILRNCVDGLNHIYSGCSKLVFSFYDVNEYVFKIPFQGMSLINYETVYDEDDNEKYPVLSEWSYDWDTFTEYSHADKDGFYPLKCNNNYCEAEEYIYNQAARWRIADCFARTFKIAEINDIPIYASKKVEQPNYGNDFSYSKKSLKTAKDILKKYKTIALNNFQVASFIEFYGDDTTDKLMSFCQKFNINDLHEGNIGFKQKRPIILDYSSFDSKDIYP